MKKKARTSGKSSVPRKKSRTFGTKRRNSRIKADAINAFKLVCVLIIASFLISFAIIKTREQGSREQGTGNREQTPSISTREGVDVITQNGASTSNGNLNEKREGVPAPDSAREPISTITAPTTTTSSSSAVSTTPATNATTSNVSATNRPANPSSNARSVATTTTAATTTSARASVEQKGSLVFVIDDAGNNLAELEPFLKINGPLTIAVLPGLPHSAESARRIRAAGKEVILHQPMEALGGQNPGPKAIYAHMSVEEIRATLKKNIEEVGPVKGINNHQGSKITMDREIMEIILEFCKENNLFFLDSRTTADTVAPLVARRLGMKIAERDTFLDNEQSSESIQRFLSSGLTRAQRNGVSVMIGHTHSPALAPILIEQFPVLTIQGYTIKTVSDILK